jgi:hypothetical protein
MLLGTAIHVYQMLERSRCTRLSHSGLSNFSLLSKPQRAAARASALRRQRMMMNVTIALLLPVDGCFIASLLCTLCYTEHT